jgi:hypothetical protein
MLRMGINFKHIFELFKERSKKACLPALKLISANTATVIALCSLAIALCSLCATLLSQMADREYRELMIRPFFSFSVNTKDLSVGFRNNGLGPAVIVDTAYRDGDECLSVGDANSHKINTENVKRVASDIGDRLFTQVFTFAIPTKSPGIKVERLNQYGSVLIPGSILETGRELWIFRIPDDTLNEFRQDLNTLQPSTVGSFMENFFEAAWALPISLRYCSMSGKYCVNLREAVVRCPLNKLREWIPHTVD